MRACLVLVCLVVTACASEPTSAAVHISASDTTSGQGSAFDPSGLQAQIADLAQAVTELQAELAQQHQASADAVAALQAQLAALPKPGTSTAPDLSGMATKADLIALQAKVTKLVQQMADLPPPVPPPDLAPYAKSADVAALQLQLQALAAKVDDLAKQPGTGGTPDLSAYAKKADLASVKTIAQVLAFPNKSTVATFSTTGGMQVFLATQADAGNAGPTIDGQAYPPGDLVLFPVLTNLAPGKHFYDRIDKCSGSCTVLILDLP